MCFTFYKSKIYFKKIFFSIKNHYINEKKTKYVNLLQKKTNTVGKQKIIDLFILKKNM